jgi:SMC interacting uncharacterized protein involved in chromosome segregation
MHHRQNRLESISYIVLIENFMKFKVIEMLSWKINLNSCTDMILQISVLL